MDDKTRIQLDRLIKENNVEETTDKIRSLKHSRLIKNDINTMTRLKREQSRLRKSSPSMFKDMCLRQCKFLYDNYTNIFNKLYKDEIDLDIMNTFLDVLRGIETGQLDQHEGSFKVGQILKELYIDSALKREKNYEESEEKRKGSKETKKPCKNINWNSYKMLHGVE
tara:strand:- start:3209 stop:3709 length:501 start_codon:yes stop_codon:yes gene_type:complete